MIAYSEKVLNRMLQQGRKEEVNEIVQKGIHRNREFGNYVIIKDLGSSVEKGL